MSEPLSEEELALLRSDLKSYEERDNSNYYGRLIRLQATEFEFTPRLLEQLDKVTARAEAVEDFIKRSGRWLHFEHEQAAFAQYDEVEAAWKDDDES